MNIFFKKSLEDLTLIFLFSYIFHVFDVHANNRLQVKRTCFQSPAAKTAPAVKMYLKSPPAALFRLSKKHDYKPHTRHILLQDESELDFSNVIPPIE